MPVDPESGGTWIAVNDAGLVMTLLNVYPKRFDPATDVDPTLYGRGPIIPSLLHCSTLAEALDLALQIEHARYPAFRLVLADTHATYDLRFAEGLVMSTRKLISEGPLMFASSGLGDALVDRPRRELLFEMFGNSSDWVATQNAYHRHSWPGRRELSVCMTRPEAKTVSHTVVELADSAEGRLARMLYFPHPPDQSGEPIEEKLKLRNNTS